MGIATELARIKTAKSDLKTAINTKGGGLIAETLDYYAAAVNALPSGGGIAAGVSFDTIDANNNVTTATVYGTFLLPYAFYNCADLTSVILPSGIPSIGAYTFYGCISLALTSLPSGITSIGAYAFAMCTNLALTSLPSGITSIDARAFFYCTSLAAISLSSGLTSIGTNAFQACNRLTKIWISSTCTSIATPSYSYSPFYGCSSGLQIYCEAASKPAGWGAYWNDYGGTEQLTVTWNTTLAQFNAL